MSAAAHSLAPAPRTNRCEHWVVKFGGHAMTRAAEREAFGHAVCNLRTLGVRPLVVHGGGPQIAQALESRNIATRRVAGVRITCREALKVVADVLGTQVNSELVATLRRHGGDAEGLRGDRDALIDATRLGELFDAHGDAVDAGFVGRVHRVDGARLRRVCETRIPVVAPLGRDRSKSVLNINADDAAAAVAAGVRATGLVFITDVQGVLDENGQRFGCLTSAETIRLTSRGVIRGGMVPKVRAARAALAAGVPVVQIRAGGIALSDSAGTLIVR
ncbi:MAG: acetylglutamate kinase [Myxococcota bacterium]